VIYGIGSAPFSATTLIRPARPEKPFRDEVIASSREQFSKERAGVEAVIQEWHAPVAKPERSDKGERGDRPQGEKPMGERPPRSHATSPRREEGAGGGERQRQPAPQRDAPRKEYRPPQEPLPPRESVMVPAQQPMTQPFKQAFSEASQPKKISETIVHAPSTPVPRASLSRLSQSNNSKSPSAQNVQSLKDVLAGVLAKKETTTEHPKESFPSVEAITQVSNDVERAKAHVSRDVPSPSPSHTHSRDEVPEDILRKVLE